MDKRILWPVLVVLALGLVAIFYPRRAAEPPPEPVTLPEPRATLAPEPAFELPEPAPEPPPSFIEQESPEPLPPLPALDESDAAARAALAAAAGADLTEHWVVPESIIRKLVATIDNLPHEALWMKSRVVPAVAGRLQVAGPEDAPRLAEENFARYAPLIRLVAAVDTAALATAYQRHYPLLQQAYEELGYPGRQFHYRALEVIDHLLATPQVRGPIGLVQPHVLYRYADPELEALSSGQKILLRIGPDHRGTVRNKLLELRAALTALAVTTPDD